jgi:hypothetical protein
MRKEALRGYHFRAWSIPRTDIAAYGSPDWLRTRGDPNLLPGKPDPDPNLH